MMGPICQRLGGRRIILASASPRRKVILENIGFPFVVVPSQFEENLDPSHFEDVWQYVEATAAGKASEVAHCLKDKEDWALVVGADTVVVSEGRILGKPGTSDRAREMLTMLSGHTHQVCTGVAVAWRKGGEVKIDRFHEVTDVTFSHLDKEVLESYVQSGEPLYGIQGLGGTLISGVRGDYFNVVGLPLHRLCIALLRILKEQRDDQEYPHPTT